MRAGWFSAIHLYPTLGEINKKVTSAIFSKKIFSDNVRKGLKFFFHLKGRVCTWEPEMAGEEEKNDSRGNCRGNTS